MSAPRVTPDQITDLEARLADARTRLTNLERTWVNSAGWAHDHEQTTREVAQLETAVAGAKATLTAQEAADLERAARERAARKDITAAETALVATRDQLQAATRDFWEALITLTRATIAHNRQVEAARQTLTGHGLHCRDGVDETIGALRDSAVISGRRWRPLRPDLQVARALRPLFRVLLGEHHPYAIGLGIGDLRQAAWGPAAEGQADPQVPADLLPERALTPGEAVAQARRTH